MSTPDKAPITALPAERDMRVGIVRTLWNSHIFLLKIKSYLPIIAFITPFVKHFC